MLQAPPGQNNKQDGEEDIGKNIYYKCEEWKVKQK